MAGQFFILIFWVVVQQLRRSEHRRGGDHLIILALDIGREDRLVVCGERVLDGLVLACH